MRQYHYIILTCVVLFGNVSTGICNPEVLSLAGEWQIRMDPLGEGIAKGWPDQVFTGDAAQLPGTAATNLRIPPVPKPTPGKGNPRGPTMVYPYFGAVWYQTEAVIPESWRGKSVTLFLERCQWETFVWVNGKFQGTRNSLVSPHIYDLSLALRPGRHRLTVMVDNANRNSGMEIGLDNLIKYLDLTTETGKQAKLNCGGHHIFWSYNWNGILGRIELRAQDLIAIASADVYPEIKTSSIRVRVTIRNLRKEKGTARLKAQWFICRHTQDRIASAEWTVELNGTVEQFVEQRLTAEKPVRCWNEFTPQLYTLALTMTSQACADTHRMNFGMRELGRRGTQFTLNGHPVFMRGAVEYLISPLTGHTPVDVPFWRSIIGTAKRYGLNLFRFHTCTPPEAAFMAADELGFYFQVELPGTSCIKKDEAKSVEAFLNTELANILKTYGNHPSLLFVSMGNEQLINVNDIPFLIRHQEVLVNKVRFGQQNDPRHLYTSTSHPYLQNVPERIDDFYVSAWPVSGNEPLCGIQWGGGRVIDSSRFNTRPPETMFDYGLSLKGLDRPLVTHEMGQWTVYPDLHETSRYHGMQRPDNYEAIRERLKEKNLFEWSGDFTRASGMLAMTLYKEEIESALRTPELGGFHLLGFRDYSSEWLATVGILNSLWESKGLITPEAFRSFCSPVVLLARLPKRVWTHDETMTAQIDMANYGLGDDTGDTIWSLQGADRRILAQGHLGTTTVRQGDLEPVGTVQTALNGITAPTKLILCVERPGVTANTWNLWVYPSMGSSAVPEGIVLCTAWDVTAREALRKGGKVLLLPSAETLTNAVLGTFTTVFWNAQTKHRQVSKTMGLLINPADPALAGFPTDYHSDWQWWDPVMRSIAMRIDGLPQALRPCVTVIDDYLGNRRLALVFEAKVGTGRLLACSIDVTSDLEARPVARQLRRSLLDYMAGPLFLPDVSVNEQELATLFK
jgi:hypothetical protein